MGWGQWTRRACERAVTVRSVPRGHGRSAEFQPKRSISCPPPITATCRGRGRPGQSILPLVHAIPISRVRSCFILPCSFSVGVQPAPAARRPAGEQPVSGEAFVRTRYLSPRSVNPVFISHIVQRNIADPEGSPAHDSLSTDRRGDRCHRHHRATEVRPGATRCSSSWPEKARRLRPMLSEWTPKPQMTKTERTMRRSSMIV